MTMRRHHNGQTYEVRRPTNAGHHSDVEYHVHPKDVVDSNQTIITINPAHAGMDALNRAMTGKLMYIDVCVWSEAGAKHYGGVEALEIYREDPDASVFERFEVRVDNLGRVA